MTNKPIPEPLYICSVGSCGYSWPADQLFWSDSIKGWCCDHCWFEVDAHWPVLEYGISLADELKQRGLSAYQQSNIDNDIINKKAETRTQYSKLGLHLLV